MQSKPLGSKPTSNKAIGMTTQTYRKNCNTCVHRSRSLVVRYKQCAIALLIQNKRSNAQKHKCCHYGCQAAESFSERNGLPNTLEAPNPVRPIKNRKWHTGQTDTASMPLWSGMCNALANIPATNGAWLCYVLLHPSTTLPSAGNRLLSFILKPPIY